MYIPVRTKVAFAQIARFAFFFGPKSITDDKTVFCHVFIECAAHKRAQNTLTTHSAHSQITRKPSHTRRELSYTQLYPSGRAPKKFVCMPGGLGEGCEVGASAPTSTNSTVQLSFRHARTGSTSSDGNQASPSPIRARPIVNAIGAGRGHATSNAEASKSSSGQCGPATH